MSEASPSFPSAPAPEAAPAAPAMPARSIDQMPAGFEDAFDPAARVAKLEAALSANQYLDGRPAQTEHMDLQIDGRQTLADGSDNPHFGHTSIVRGEEPVRSAIDDSFVRSLDRPDRTMLGDLPKDQRVELLSSRNSVSSLRDGITQTREALATAQGIRTETVKKPNKKGTKFLDHDVVIGPDRTAEADAQERLGDYMDALGTKLARSGMSDERVLQTLIRLNEGTPAHKRKVGETKSGKAKYETVEAKPGLNLSEEEMTQVLDALTRTQEQDEIAREIAKADEPLTPDEAALAAHVLGERPKPVPAAPSRTAPRPTPARPKSAPAAPAAAPSRTAPRPAPRPVPAPAEKPAATPTAEEQKAKFEADVAAADAEIRADWENAPKDMEVRDFLISTFESKIRAHLIGGKETQAFVKKPMGIAIQRLLSGYAEAESKGDDDKYTEIMDGLKQEISEIAQRVKVEVAPKRFGSKILRAVGVGRPKRAKAPKIKIPV